MQCSGKRPTRSSPFMVGCIPSLRQGRRAPRESLVKIGYAYRKKRVAALQIICFGMDLLICSVPWHPKQRNIQMGSQCFGWHGGGLYMESGWDCQAHTHLDFPVLDWSTAKRWSSLYCHVNDKLAARWNIDQMYEVLPIPRVHACFKVLIFVLAACSFFISTCSYFYNFFCEK